MIHKILSTKRLNNENGMALVLVLLLIMIFSVLTLGVIGVTSSNLTLTTGERDHQSAYYIAEAGINVRMQEIEAEIIKAYEETDTHEAFYSQMQNAISIDTIKYITDFNKEQAKAETVISLNNVSENDFSRTYSITSEGTIDNRLRTLHTDIIIDWKKLNAGPPLVLLNDVAVFSNSAITVNHNNANITGSVATNSKDNHHINSESISGNIYYGPETDDAFIQEDAKRRKMANEMIYELPTFPIFPELNTNTELFDSNPIVLNGNYYIPDIYADNLTIDVGNSDREIVVDKLNIKNSNLQIDGEGSLTIYVTDEILMDGGQSTINKGGNVGALNIFLQASDSASHPKSLRLSSSNQKIVGSFYGEDTEIIMSGGNFTGNLITGGETVDIGGNSEYTGTIYAPKAHVSMGANYTFRGRIISNSFEAKGSGNSQIIFDDIEDQSLLPFFSDPPNEGETVNIDELIINTSPIREQ